MSQVDTIEETIAPALEDLGLELVDVEIVGSGRARTLRVSVDRDGGIDLDTVTEATRAVNPLLERASLVEGSYTLEVSSPGLERRLRRPEHFARVVGDTVSVKSRDAQGKVVRRQATLRGATASGIDLEVDGALEHLGYDDIVAARTVFEWRSGA